MSHWQSDVLSFHRKDGKMIMNQDKNGNIEITDDKFGQQVEEKCPEVINDTVTKKAGKKKNK